MALLSTPLFGKPQPAWLDAVIDFANMADAAGIRGRNRNLPTVTDWRRDEARRTCRRITGHDDPGKAAAELSGITDDADHKALSEAILVLQTPASLSISPAGSDWKFVPARIDVDDPAASSQERLRAVLDLLSKRDKITPAIERRLNGAICEINVIGALPGFKVKFTALDQWWGFPLAAYADQVIGRIRRCQFRRCRDYFIDWPGRKGQRMEYCGIAHQNAEHQARHRDRERERKAASDAKRKQARERRAAKESLRRLKERKAATTYTGGKT